LWAKGQLKIRSIFLNIMEKGCLTGTGFTRQKNITAGVLNKVIGEF